MFKYFKKKASNPDPPATEISLPVTSHGWTCQCCGKWFETLPTSFAFEGPIPYLDLSPEERKVVSKSDDICIFSDHEFYVRGIIEIPIIGMEQSLEYGVWCSVSLETMRYLKEHADKEFSPDDEPRFGWLFNWPNGYQPKEHIKCHLYFRNDNLRPLVMLEPTDYALAVEQRNGVTIEHVQRIAAECLAHLHSRTDHNETGA